MYQEILDWFANLNPEIKKHADEINSFILTYELVTKFKYKTPFYYDNSWICYLSVDKKNDVISVSFVRSNELNETNELLDFKGRKMVGSLDFNAKDKLDFTSLAKVLEEAIELDNQVKYSPPARRKK